MKGIVYHQGEGAAQDLGGGTSRKILGWTEDMMAVEVAFETGAEGAPHSHPHTQCSYVLSGAFSYSVEGEAALLKAGDCIVVPGGLIHGTTCLEKGVLLDVFTPCRKDFLPQQK